MEPRDFSLRFRISGLIVSFVRVLAFATFVLLWSHIIKFGDFATRNNLLKITRKRTWAHRRRDLDVRKGDRRFGSIEAPPTEFCLVSFPYFEYSLLFYNYSLWFFDFPPTCACISVIRNLATCVYISVKLFLFVFSFYIKLVVFIISLSSLLNSVIYSLLPEPPLRIWLRRDLRTICDRTNFVELGGATEQKTGAR